MDCGFYIIYLCPDKKITKKISEFWEEQKELSKFIRDSYDKEVENKFLNKTKKTFDLKKNNEQLDYTN